ncbi:MULTISPECIES: hypothetical protein [unclassified Clostridium]|uniref:hypothetical protein n=1 Tax=unclassified Clostridium TaxID=2614128 RepID=UPI00321780C4
MTLKDIDIKNKFKNLELEQLEKHNEKLSSALVAGVVIAAIGIGYKVTRTIMKVKGKR